MRARAGLRSKPYNRARRRRVCCDGGARLDPHLRLLFFPLIADGAVPTMQTREPWAELAPEIYAEVIRHGRVATYKRRRRSTRRDKRRAVSILSKPG